MYIHIKTTKRIQNAGQQPETASAMIETVILMPIYMILVFALIFFGHSTLSRQRARVAAHFVAMHSSTQALDEDMLVHFGWNPSLLGGYRSVPDGSEFQADDAVIRVLNIWGEEDYYNPDYSGAPTRGTGTFEEARIADYVWIESVGEVVERYEWQDGEIVRIEDQQHTYASSYLQDQDIVDPPPPSPPVYTRYLLGAADAVNNAQDNPWLERRYGRMEYEYGPNFLRYAIGEEPMTSDQYLGLDFPDPTFQPLFVLESRGMTRGLGNRRGTLESGASSVRINMSYLLGNGSDLPGSIPLSELDSIKDSLWPDDPDSVWMAK